MNEPIDLYAHFCEERAIEELKAVGVQVVHTPRYVEDTNPRDISGHFRAGEEAIDVIVGMNRKISLVGKDVAHLSHLSSLGELCFHGVTLGPDGLAPMKRLPKLKELEIYLTNLTDRDLKSVGRQTQLETLTIYGCPVITTEGLAHLKTLTQLKKLSVRSCNGIAKESLSALAQELPGCRLEFSEY